MKKLVPIIITAAVVVGGAVFLLTGNKSTGTAPVTSGANQPENVGGKTISAKQAYPIALSEAKKFSPDVFLADLNTTGVQKDGKSKTWYIFFYSPAKKTNFKVNVVDGKVEQTDDNNKNKTDPIADGWIDSSEVAKIAIPKCEEAGQIAEPDYFINLEGGTEGKSPTWNMNCLVGENKTFKVYVDAVTGEFLKTGKAGIGW